MIENKISCNTPNVDLNLLNIKRSGHEAKVIKSIFKRRTTNCWFEISFFKTGFLFKPKALCLPNYLPIAEEEQMDSYLTQGNEREVKYELLRPGFEIGSPNPFSTTINITQRMYVIIQLSHYELDATSLIFKRSTTASLNSGFSFYMTGCCTEAKGPSLPKCFYIAGWRWDVSMHFQKTLARSEIQITSIRNWTRVADSLSYKVNRYTKCVSFVWH